MAHGAGGAGRGAPVTVAAYDSVASLRDAILDAGASRAPLRVAGRGTWLDAGRPVRAERSISTRDLAGITQYVPGDLTLTALAGTTLAEIRDATAAHGQWLAMDPHGGDDGTLGATIATGSAGPLLTSFGRPRDLVLGVEFVTGAGVVARAGGRVVKNVAGFDVTRLMTGSWGTLGVLTEISVRLHARPEADESLAIAPARDADAAPWRVRQLLRRLPFVPYACEVLNAELAGELGAGSGVTVVARLGGNREAVRAQRAALDELGDARAIDPQIWRQLRAAEPAGAQVVRLSRLPSEIEHTWAQARDIAARCPGTLLHATPARGIVRCIVPRDGDATVERLRDALSAAAGATLVGERLEPDLWRLCSRARASDDLSARVKHAFDPDGILNPGLLGEPS